MNPIEHHIFLNFGSKHGMNKQHVIFPCPKKTWRDTSPFLSLFFMCLKMFVKNTTAAHIQIDASIMK